MKNTIASPDSGKPERHINEARLTAGILAVLSGFSDGVIPPNWASIGRKESCFIPQPREKRSFGKLCHHLVTTGALKENTLLVTSNPEIHGHCWTLAGAIARNPDSVPTTSIHVCGHLVGASLTPLMLGSKLAVWFKEELMAKGYLKHSF